MDLATKIVKKVEKTISKYHMLEHGDRVIVAVSGGADSVCLLHILHRLTDVWGLTLVVAHFNHGLRPDADEDETRFVRIMASSLHLDVVVEKAQPAIPPEGASLEERARDARYRFLKNVQKEYDAHKIATGHTLNDQAETVLMRLLRGSGPAGLSGIHPVRENFIIRPLIEISRIDIEAYLGHRQLEHMTDASNTEVRHLRNDIRLNLIPQLQRYQPRIIEVLGRTAEITGEENRWFDAQAETWIKKQRGTGPSDEMVIPLSGFTDLPEPLQNHVVRKALQMVSGSLSRINLHHIEAIKRLAKGTKPQAEVMLPHRIRVRRVYERLIFSTGGMETAERFCCFIERPGSFDLHDLGCTLLLEEIERKAVSDLKARPWTACLDA
ncbi:MAG: tRNA lysidine(34) synthetase TilS, partial [Deltaproteobacteria bacterium]|nr:tRNA lysidine(34) synthetase TilS [Deltaproteobacteria bacterium]